MSHDIRTPMNVIVGLSNLMEHELDNPQKMREYIQKIQTSSNHLLGLINDVLDMSKIESGENRMNIETFDLTEQIREIDMLIYAKYRFVITDNGIGMKKSIWSISLNHSAVRKIPSQTVYRERDLEWQSPKISSI